MNTVRSPSRNSNVSSTSSTSRAFNAPSVPSMPRKAKVASMAQMDISSISLTQTNTRPPRNYGQQHQPVQQPASQPRPTIKIRTSGPIPTTGSLKSNNNGGAGALTSRESSGVIRVSNGGGSIINGGNSSNNSSSVGRRMGAGVVGLGVSGNRVHKEGSVTSSDDGTVSEDSVDDHIQLFSGAGGGGNGSLRVPSRQGSIVSSSTGPKAPSTIGRTKSSSSISAGTVTAAKPMRIAAGASIRIDTTQSSSSTHAPIPSFSLSGTGAGAGSGGANVGSSVGVLSTSVSSSTSSSSSSVSWVSSPPHRNDDSASYMTSPTASNNINNNTNNTNNNNLPTSTQPPQGQGQPAVRALKPSNTSAAAVKQAEENRRAEEAARTRRKIQDLEISNASLLQVNQTLEATIRKQTAEMQELKMRIQSAQFGGDLSLLTADIPLSQELDGAAADSEAAVIIHELTEAERQADLTFRRLCMTIEHMIFEAKQAVDQSTKKAGVKVLSSFDMYEKESMEDEAEEDELDAADQSIILNEDENDPDQPST